MSTGYIILRTAPELVTLARHSSPTDFPFQTNRGAVASALFGRIPPIVVLYPTIINKKTVD